MLPYEEMPVQVGTQMMQLFSFKLVLRLFNNNLGGLINSDLIPHKRSFPDCQMTISNFGKLIANQTKLGHGRRLGA